MLTGKQVVAKQFDNGRRGGAYDEIAVDDFLDRVAKTLDAYERGHRLSDPVTASAVDDVVFPEARGLDRRGYDAEAVGAFLAKVRETLRAHESQEASSGPKQQYVEAATHEVPSAVTQPKASFWSRMRGR